MEIIEFDNLDDMLAYQARLEEAAQQAILPSQRAMKPGDFWMRPVDEMGIFVFGRWHTPDEVYEAEREAGAPEAEAQQARAHEAERAARGYMFGTAYSPIEPEGELGSTHVSLVWPISEGEFLNAQDHFWELGSPASPDPENPLVAAWFVRLLNNMKRQVAAEILDMVTAGGNPLFNLRSIGLILAHPEWWEPQPRETSLTADMVLEVVEDAE